MPTAARSTGYRFDAEAARKAGHALAKGPVAQALAIQRQLLLDALSPDTTASARAQVARAWSELEERKREIRGHGKPKPVEAKNARLKQGTRNSVAPLAREPAEASGSQSAQPSLPANITPPESH